MAFKNKISTAAKVLVIPALAGFLASCKPKSEPIQTDRQITSTHLTINLIRPLLKSGFVKGKRIQDTAKLPGKTLCFTLDSLGVNAFNPKDSLFMPYIEVSEKGKVLYSGPTSNNELVAVESNGTRYHIKAVGTEESPVMGRYTKKQPGVIIAQSAILDVIYELPDTAKKVN